LPEQVSGQNVELVRCWYAAAARHDIDELLAAFSDDVEWDLTAMGWLESEGIYRGKPATRRFIEQWFGSFDEHAFVLEEFEYVDYGDRVLVHGKQRGRGSGSGAKVEQSFSHLFTLREGLICRTQLFPTADEALRAAGPSE
jgi:ketosteroid isomerase-like protein